MLNTMKWLGRKLGLLLLAAAFMQQDLVQAQRVVAPTITMPICDYSTRIMANPTTSPFYPAQHSEPGGHFLAWTPDYSTRENKLETQPGGDYVIFTVDAKWERQWRWWQASDNSKQSTDTKYEYNAWAIADAFGGYRYEHVDNYGNYHVIPEDGGWTPDPLYDFSYFLLKKEELIGISKDFYGNITHTNYTKEVGNANYAICNRYPQTKSHHVKLDVAGDCWDVPMIKTFWPPPGNVVRCKTTFPVLVPNGTWPTYCNPPFKHYNSEVDYWATHQIITKCSF